MNLNPPPSSSGRENFSNVQPNTGQAPFAPNQLNPNSPNMMPQFRPRMDQPHQNQQQMQQQRNMQMNYQQGPRFPGENPIRFPPSPASDSVIRPNGASQNFVEYQRGSGTFPQGPRMQMGPQPRFPGPQLQTRPLVNDPNLVASNQPRLANFQQMDPTRPLTHNIPPNQALPQAENYQRQIIRDQPPILSRKSSALDINASNNFPKLIRNESKSQLEIKPDNSMKNVPLSTPKEPQQDSENSKSEQEQDKPADDLHNNNDSESQPEVIQNCTKSEKKTKDINRKEINQGESFESHIKSGTVLKNIKFFENKDTAKTPLVPQEITVKKKERKIVSSPDVVKCEFHEDEYESGVDETPMVYPNLGSIFEMPRKVAKIPYRRIVKSLGKPRSDKKSRPPFQVYFKSRQSSQKSRVKHSYSHLLYKNESSKVSKIKNFGPDEELLAFFESTDSWRKLKRYGSSRVGHNASKDKLENKPKTNGDIGSPKKTPSKLPGPSKKNQPVSPARTPLKSPGTPGAISLPKTPDSPAPSTPLIKKVPMNKIQVGAAPSPNLKTVRSKIGSLANTTHKPGGGNVKIESHKIDLSNAQARIEAKNDQYKRSGGDKKIPQVKLQWSAKPKIGSLENATYKPGGGDKKIESVKLDFKEKAKPKVGSKDNVKHVPGGGNVKIENQKLEFKAQSKVGSLDNVKHKPGGGDVKIFDDKTYLKQISGTSSEGRVSGTQSYGDLSVVREVEGRSAPGTPGRKTSVKIKKTTTIQNGMGMSTLKNVTEVTVVSQTPKKEKTINKSPSKQQVKLIYSKIESNSMDDPNSPVEIVKTEAKTHAPLLKSNLSKKDVFDIVDINGKEKKVDFDNTSKEVKNFENLKQSSASSNLPEGKLHLKDDAKMAKDFLDYTPTQEKIGEIWKERNTADEKSYEWQQKQKQSGELSSSVKYAPPADSRPLGNNFQKNVDDPRMSNYYSQKSIHSQEIYQPTPFTQSQQQFPPGQQKFPSSQQQRYNSSNP